MGFGRMSTSLDSDVREPALFEERNNSHVSDGHKGAIDDEVDLLGNIPARRVPW